MAICETGLYYESAWLKMGISQQLIVKVSFAGTLTKSVERFMGDTAQTSPKWISVVVHSSRMFRISPTFLNRFIHLEGNL
jgi:hypothetical protein